MSVPLARLAHKGPRGAQRIFWGAADLRPVAGVLRAGENICAGLGRIYAEAGCRGGVTSFDGVSCDPLFYVGPAESRDPAFAAYYSDQFLADPGQPIRGSSVTVGLRDGAPFFHCHGQWLVGGQPVMGHLLPHETFVAADCPVSGIGAPDNAFVTRFDPETNFPLFHPEREGGQGNGVLIRLAPDEDVVTAVEAVAAEAGISAARIHGVGSICEPHFEGQGRISTPITEGRIDHGQLRDGRAEIGVSYVDTGWTIYRGRLVRGLNPVGVTFELLLEAEA